jgi:hypothetical protein
VKDQLLQYCSGVSHGPSSQIAALDGVAHLIGC